MSTETYDNAIGIKTLDRINSLGALYTNQGKLYDAEKLYRWALQGYEEALGPKNQRCQHLRDTIRDLD